MKYIFFFLILFLSLHSMAQTITGDRVVARQGIYVRDYWIDSIQRDTAFEGKIKSIPTSDAIKRFVANRIAKSAISLTTDNISGAATYINGVLNIPNYSGKNYALVTKPFNSVMTFNEDESVHQKVVMTGNITSMNFANFDDGETLYLVTVQDETGGREITNWPPSTKIYGSGLSSDPHAEDLVRIKFLGGVLYVTYGGANGTLTTTDNNLSIVDQIISTKKALKFAIDAATVVIDASQGIYWEVTIEGNRQLDIQNAQDGDVITIYIKQDATGGRTMGWLAGTMWTNGAPPTLHTSGGTLNRIVYHRKGTEWIGSY